MGWEGLHVSYHMTRASLRSLSLQTIDKSPERGPHAFCASGPVKSRTASRVKTSSTSVSKLVI